MSTKAHLTERNPPRGNVRPYIVPCFVLAPPLFTLSLGTLSLLSHAVESAHPACTPHRIHITHTTIQHTRRACRTRVIPRYNVRSSKLLHPLGQRLNQVDTKHARIITYQVQRAECTRAVLALMMSAKTTFGEGGSPKLHDHHVHFC